MKRLVLMFLLIGVVFTGCKGENNLLLLIPSDVPDKTRPSKKDYEPPETMKISYSYKEKEISNLSKTNYPNENSVFLENYFSMHNSITRKQLIAFLNSDEKFIIQRNYNDDINIIVVVESSYGKICRRKNMIGEFFFHGGCGHEKFEVLGSFGYSLSYLDNNKIDMFGLGFNLSEEDFNVFSSIPDIFIKKNGTWYWKKGRQSVTDLYNLMESRDSRLPKVFIDLQETWENIMANLKIDGVKVEVR